MRDCSRRRSNLIWSLESGSHVGSGSHAGRFSNVRSGCSNVGRGAKKGQHLRSHLISRRLWAT